MQRESSALPELRTEIPGPASRALAQRLALTESRNITSLSPLPPIFWQEASGATVRDADGNTFIDLTAGFGVSFAGHSNPAVASAIADQAARLAHGLGDVHPPTLKVELLEKLAAIAPGDLSVSILASDGADAVEAALKTARMRTGSDGVIAFRDAYHGLSYGALATTWREDFRSPFASQLNQHVRFVPFPHGEPDPDPTYDLDAAVRAVQTCVDQAAHSAYPIGAVIVEPVQGRGGIVTPPPGFLHALREICDGSSIVLIFDEIYTGMGRTGDWFACNAQGVVPDILTVGKGLTGSLPLSAAIGSPAVMSAWPPSHGEAIHTSTFLGNPVACAAALAQISEIERLGLMARSRSLGAMIAARLERWVASRLIVARRGNALIQGARVTSPERGLALVSAALQKGLIMLPEGDGSVLALTPPAVITEEQLEWSLDTIEALLAT